MCIIAIKSAGVPIDWDILDNCELSNPDGAGYAYVRDGEVVISKGYFTNEEMRAVIEPELGNGTGVEIMFHFRIATHGKVAPSTCHPFPLTHDRQEILKLQTTTSVAVAHNGVIPFMPKDKVLSDTMQYILLYLAPLGDRLNDESVRNLIEHSADSKLAIMTADELYLIGQFIEDAGWTFSNNSYADDYFTIAKRSGFSQPLGPMTGTSTMRIDDEWSYDSWDSHKDYLEFCDVCQKQYDPVSVDTSTILKDTDWFLCADCLEQTNKQATKQEVS